MVLDSQSTRSGMSRRYMVSRRRSSRRWLWIVILAVVAVGAGYFLLSGGDADADASPAQAGPARANAATPTREAAPQPRRVAEMKPAPVLAPRKPAPAPEPTATPVAKPIAPPVAQSTARTAPPAAAPVTPAPAPKPVAAAPATVAPRPTPASTGPAAVELSRGMDLIADGKLVEGRKLLSRLLLEQTASLTVAEQQMIRDTLTSVNRGLVFSREVQPGDTVAEAYVVQSGDLLARIAPRFNLTYQFLERINNIEARRLQVGQKIKVIKGPFHARVDKSEYRMDILLTGPDGAPIYVRSFPVGVGQEDSTPPGRWVIEPGRKVTNPSWRNPRTSEYYTSDDPKNPIGEYWLALEGADSSTASLPGYGIHGTIDPDSIGSQASMGCIRLRDDDIKLVYEMLVEGESTVLITP